MALNTHILLPEYNGERLIITDIALPKINTKIVAGLRKSFGDICCLQNVTYTMCVDEELRYLFG